MPEITGVDDVIARLDTQGYLIDRRLATAVFLALRLNRPLLLEGEAGVGKTELAKALAATLDTPLLRLQCYEGLDIAQAVYEWNVPRQMLEIRLAEATGETDRERLAPSLYRRELLIERPLLQALTQPRSPVLLIDELDRADEPFEAFLLETLAERQITIPELGTIRAAHPPLVLLTSNRTREIHDALRRRCLYAWVDYPDPAREIAILRRKAPEAGEDLARQVSAFVQRVRGLELFKPPGIAEAIDWAQALAALDAVALTPALAHDTLGALLKYQDDLLRLPPETIRDLIDERDAGDPARR